MNVVAAQVGRPLLSACEASTSPGDVAGVSRHYMVQPLAELEFDTQPMCVAAAWGCLKTLRGWGVRAKREVGWCRWPHSD